MKFKKGDLVKSDYPYKDNPIYGIIKEEVDTDYYLICPLLYIPNIYGEYFINHTNDIKRYAFDLKKLSKDEAMVELL